MVLIDESSALFVCFGASRLSRELSGCRCLMRAAHWIFTGPEKILSPRKVRDVPISGKFAYRLRADESTHGN